MNIVNMRGYRVLSFDYVGKLAQGQKITLQNTCSYNVRYGKDGVCAGTLTCKVSDKERPEAFHINIEMEGVFSFDGNVAREQIHVATFKELFPQARAVVSAVTALYGITPVIIPPVDIEGQSIYRIDADNLKP